jgi:hypothetical protein
MKSRDIRVSGDYKRVKMSVETLKERDYLEDIGIDRKEI